MSATKSKPVGRAVRVKPSPNPQNVSSMAWYYENKGSLEVFVATTLNGSASASVRIPWSMIQRSLARCKPKALGLSTAQGRKK